MKSNQSNQPNQNLTNLTPTDPQIATGVVTTMKPIGDKLEADLVPEMLATDLAEYLVRAPSPRTCLANPPFPASLPPCR